MRRAWANLLFSVFMSILFLGAGRQAEAKDGLYVGGELLYNQIGGDFNGVDGPDVDPGRGIGLIVGYALPELSFQLNWNATVHTAKISNGARSSDAGYGALIISVKHNFRSDQPFRPFVRAGIGSHAFALNDPSLGKLKLYGAGLDLALGADYYLSSGFSIGADISRRFVRYSRQDFQGNRSDLNPKIKGDTITVGADLTYHF